jgi:uncharacterized protein YjbJ (UPF0337 family)
MNWEVIEGNWEKFKGKAKVQWRKLTDDQLATVAGKRDQLASRIQEAYGVTELEAEAQIKSFEDRSRTLSLPELKGALPNPFPRTSLLASRFTGRKR